MTASPTLPANRVRASFAPTGSSVASARAFVRATLTEWGADAVIDDAVLLTSELVTNAIVHAGTPAEVTCTRLDGAIRIDVADRHPSRSLSVPERTVSETESEAGRGLFLSAALASAWGVQYTRATKEVWFALDLPPEVSRHGRATAQGQRAPSAPYVEGYEAHGRAVTVENPDAPSALAALSGPVANMTWTDLVDESGRVDPEELMQRTVERARDLFVADAAVILLADDDGLEVRATTGVPMPTPPTTTYAVPLAARRIDLSVLPGVHQDLATEPVDPVGLPFLADIGLRALLTAPLLVHGRLIGMIVVGTHRPGGYGNDDAGRLQQAADNIALVVESARLTELERVRRGALSFIAEASDLLAGSLDADRTLALAAQLVVPRLADWCAVHMLDDAGRTRLRHVWHADEDRHDMLVELVEAAGAPACLPGAPWPALGETAARLGADEPSADDAVGPRAPQSTYAGLAAGDLLVLPLTARGRARGTLSLGTAPGGRFRREITELADDLTRRVALALDNALLYADRTRSSELLQRSLLPPAVPIVPGVDVHVVYQASGDGNEVGGDFYDLFEIRDGLWGFAIGDVCGTGPEAASVTGLARHSLRLLAREGLSMPAVLERLNRAILDEGERSRFLTLLYGELEPRPDGSLGLAMVCAGHPLPLVLRRDGSVRASANPQPLLGVLPKLDLYVEEHELAADEILLAFTDGASERREGTRMLGDDGLAAILASCNGLTAAAVATRVERAVEAFSSKPRNDDMAILVIRAGETPRV
jgi:serine phosphatase RsbU (regulator of sigma subunit)/anti-sigma regulatory factor (Ser/Thr protein kinase)